MLIIRSQPLHVPVLLAPVQEVGQEVRRPRERGEPCGNIIIIIVITIITGTTIIVIIITR
jgi:hypothetical protein